MDHEKIVTHSKFKKKFESDLNRLYETHQLKQFVEQFKAYKKFGTPPPVLIHRYYRALMDLKLYYYVNEYAIELLRSGEGVYEDNMNYMLKAMIKEERYDEVIDITLHLLSEEIPHRFRIELNILRDKAQQKVRKKRDTKKPRLHQEDKITDNEYAHMSREEKMAFIQRISKEEDKRYSSMLESTLKHEGDNHLITLILNYLRICDVNRKIAIEKQGKSMVVIPKKLPSFEETTLYIHVSPDVLDELAKNAPNILDIAEAIMVSITFEIYPFDPPFEVSELINGILSLCHDMVNIPHDYKASEEVIDWIKQYS